MLIQVQEVIALKQLIAELSERHAMVGVGSQALLHAVLSHHVVNCDVLAYVANEIQERELLHPVIVVHQDCMVRSIAIEVKEVRQLSLNRLLVVAKRLLINQLALLRLHRWVTNHTSCTTHQCYGAMASTLKVLQHHDAHQVANVKRVGSRVNAHIRTRHFLVQLLFSTRHDICNHPAPSKFFYKIHKFLSIIF